MRHKAPARRHLGKGRSKRKLWEVFKARDVRGNEKWYVQFPFGPSECDSQRQAEMCARAWRRRPEKDLTRKNLASFGYHFP